MGQWKQYSSVIWAWDEGEFKTLEGEFAGWDKFTGGDFGEVNRYYVDIPEAGRVSCICGSAFDKIFEQANIVVGDKIRIEYRGKKNLSDGRRVNLFNLGKWTEGEEDPTMQPKPKAKKK